MTSIVGNVPYNMDEVRIATSTRTHSDDDDTAQGRLIDAFKSVGHVVGFRFVSTTRASEDLSTVSLSRLVFDRDTGKPKGYGFCEFAGTCLVPPIHAFVLASISELERRSDATSPILRTTLASRVRRTRTPHPMIPPRPTLHGRKSACMIIA